MREWIRIIKLAIQGIQHWTIITLFRSTTQSAKIYLRHTLQLNCNDNYRHWIVKSVLICSMKRIHTFSGKPGKNLRKWCGANTSIFLEAPKNSSWTNRDYQLLISEIFWLSHVLKFLYFNNTLLIYPSMHYGASPETNPRNPQFLVPEAIRNT